MKYLYSFLLACTFLLATYSVKGQNLTIQDRLEIILQSKQIIREYEILLNNLSDFETTETIGNILIRNSYTSGRNQIFFNSGVILEDDIHPLRTRGLLSPEDVEVQQYLQDFTLFYAKTSQRTISFENIRELSDVEEGQYKYLRVYFESTFSGTHKEVKEAYQMTKRVAEIRIEKDGSRWRPYIAGIDYYKDPEESTLEIVEPDTSTNPLPEEVTVFTPVEDNTQIEEDPVETTETPGEIEVPEETPQENGITFDKTQAYQFTYPNVATVKKPGANLAITWMNQQKLPGPIELKLIRNGKVIKTLLPQFYGTSFGWNIEKSTKSGTYQLEVRSKEDPESYGLSPKFKIKSRFPLWLIIGLPVALGGITAILLAQDGGGGGNPPDNRLPPAPDPDN